MLSHPLKRPESGSEEKVIAVQAGEEQLSGMSVIKRSIKGGEEDHKPGLFEAQKKLRMTEGELAFQLDLFGDEIAKRQHYKTLTGLDALHYYLIQKHHWLPSQVQSLNWKDLRFLFEEEMHGWTAKA